ncbi:hypothetical protein M405DRAFT_928505 [Rhizopogon salebrosus TDB-379]|nr:hypothetical protein M405DRAFT_928505 [Rhizopogon salebrosus TDB-379]
MRFPVAVLVLSAAVSSVFAALVARQSLPNCAVPCITNADYGNCSSTDDTCLCHSQAFINSTTTCIQASCTGSDLTNAEAASQALCAAVGVTLTTAPASTGVSSATSTGTSKSASSASSSTASPTSNAASSNSINVLTGAAALAILAASF